VDAPKKFVVRKDESNNAVKELNGRGAAVVDDIERLILNIGGGRFPVG